MSLRIVEFFGLAPGSPGWKDQASSGKCPFVGGNCRKQLHDGSLSGVCTLAAATDTTPVICCPYRLYDNKYEVLERVAKEAFSAKACLWMSGPRPKNSAAVRILGKEQGKEIRVPNRNKGFYSVDWVLALIDPNGNLQEFVAVEVQTIDTTGNYKAERAALLSGDQNPERSKAGFNWENVNKRIIPQVIYKGHALRRESKCKKGLYFITPKPVCDVIRARVGNSLISYQPQPGSITFHSYGLKLEEVTGRYHLEFSNAFTTTVDQLALAFSSPTNLPDEGVFETAIAQALEEII